MIVWVAPDSDLMAKSQMNDSTFSRRIDLYAKICGGVLGKDLLEELLPQNKPHEYEDPLWDYKRVLPVTSPAKSRSASGKKDFDCSIAEIVKDVTAFHNSYGGYLVIGITDSPKEIVGFDADFSCDELNHIVESYTHKSIETRYESFEISKNGLIVRVGVLFIPQRSDAEQPVSFAKAAPKSDTGRQAFNKNDIYMRQRDACRPAKQTDDFGFLFTPGRRQFSESKPVMPRKILDNNLPARDPSLIKFVGRDTYIEEIWKWLLDPYNPLKLLSGLGGVGKTSIARYFAEEIITNSPAGFEKVVWLSAKKMTYAAIQGKYVETTRYDFKDVDSLLKRILMELGHNSDDLKSDLDRQQLMMLTLESLKHFPSVLVVDDVDSLDDEEQHDLFHTVLSLFTQTIGFEHSSRAILTARLELGAGPSQLLSVGGLEPDEFQEYVELTARHLGIEWSWPTDSKVMRRFHRVSGGSPVFASSILRLLTLGEDIGHALKSWERSDGEDVRKFAFGKELDALSDSQLRILFALSLLGEATFIELLDISGRKERALKDDLAALREYHLISNSKSGIPGGPKLSAPSGIRMMTDLMRERLTSPKSIEKVCAKIRSQAESIGANTGSIVGRVLALWRDDKSDLALELSQMEASKDPKNPDLLCLLGRANLMVSPPQARRADKEFRKAFELGSSRAELPNLWIQSKKIAEDWIGVIEITNQFLSNDVRPEYIVEIAEAYRELGRIALSTGNVELAGERFKAGGLIVSEAFHKGNAAGRVEPLKDLQRELYSNYVNCIDRQFRDPDQHIEVWLACFEAFQNYTRQMYIVELGVDRLSSWWYSVLRRDDAKERTANLMEVQIERLERVYDWLASLEVPPVRMLQIVGAVRERLYRSWRDYRNDLN